jgi:hypothetical protein
MKKRLIKKLKKRLGLWNPLIIIEATKSPIPVSKFDLKPHTTDSLSSEDRTVFELRARDIKIFTESLTKWIEDYGFVKPLENYLSRHQETGDRTAFFDTGPQDATRPIWFIGDLHGDISALKMLTDFAHVHDKRNSITKPTRLFFLGDYTDDAPFSAEVVAWLIKQTTPGLGPLKEESGIKHHEPFEVMPIVGNHDEGLRFIENDGGGKFVSSVSPSTFVDELNERLKGSHGEAWKAFGLGAINFFKAMPRMVILDKTVMVAHGGVPHSDVMITKREDLNSAQALSDFVWNRLHETAPKKFPNRESRGSQLGLKDFEAFIAKLENADVGGFMPSIFIRGHDHHDDNFKLYENFKKCSVLTLNAFTVNRGTYGKKFRDLALLRWVPSESGEMALFQLKFKDGVLEKMWHTIAPNNGMFLQ